MWIDSHCHLDLLAAKTHLPTALAAAYRQDVRAIIAPAVGADNWQSVLALKDAHIHIHPALGLHPCFLAQHRREHLWQLEKTLQQHRVVAIGEFGLDYFIADFDADLQHFYAVEQLKIAKKWHLPVILHVRRAHDAMLKLLRQFKLEQAGVVHAFSGSWQQAQQYVDLGFVLGFGGAPTYPRASKLKKIFQQLPLTALVLETDAPDMPPVFLDPKKPNQPAYLPKIGALLAEYRQLEPRELAAATAANCARIFGDLGV